MDVGIIKGSVVSMIPLSILIFCFYYLRTKEDKRDKARSKDNHRDGNGKVNSTKG